MRCDELEHAALEPLRRQADALAAAHAETASLQARLSAQSPRSAADQVEAALLARAHGARTRASLAAARDSRTALPSPSLSERSIGLSELCVCPATAASAQRWR